MNNLKDSQDPKGPPGWTFHDIEVGPWSGGDSLDKPCRTKNWFGFSQNKNNGEASISTTLYGKGKAVLSFGNCWRNGNVAVYKNDDKLKSVGRNSEDIVEFEFKDRDVIKITETGYAVIQFNYIRFIWCSSGKKLF